MNDDGDDDTAVKNKEKPTAERRPTDTHDAHCGLGVARAEKLLHRNSLAMRVFLAFLVLTLCHVSLILAAEPIIIEDDHPLLNDPDALQAMEIFMGMSPDEREEAIAALMDAVEDDPEARAEMELLLSQLPALDAEQLKNSPGGTHSSLDQMVQDDEFAKAKENLGTTPWDFFVENADALLEATIAGGKISPEEAATFKTDKEAWLKQLRIIWEDVATEDTKEEL